MTVNTAFSHRFAAYSQRLRSNPYLAFGVALAAVAVATLIRFSVGDLIAERLPFAVYFPAIVLATLVGGIWPGVFATAASALLAWYFFIPPAFGFSLTVPESTALILFVLIASLSVALIAVFNATLDRLLIELEHRDKEHIAAQHLAAIVESSDDAIIAKDLDGIITAWNGGAERLFGYTAEEAVGKPVSMLIPLDRFNEEPSILERLRRGVRIDHYETVRRHKDGSLIDISLTVSPVTDARGTIIGASKIARDITGAKRAAAQQEMLIREMSHRIKNAFAVVSGLVSLSAKSARSPSAMAKQIHERIASLGRAHELTRPGLIEPRAGASRSMLFTELVHAIFAPYIKSADSDGGRLRINVHNVAIREESVTPLALFLHELATNAVKYGALSSTDGFVDLALSLDNDKWSMTWREEGGPLILETPKGVGFGTQLSRRIVESQFGGQIHYDWRKQGLLIRLSIPLKRSVFESQDTSETDVLPLPAASL